MIHILTLNFFSLECWDGEPNTRPHIRKVVELLKALISENDQTRNLSEDVDDNKVFDDGKLFKSKCFFNINFY